MSHYSLFFYFLLAELAILASLFIAIVVHRGIYSWVADRDKRRAQLLTAFILKWAEQNEPFTLNDYPGKRKWHQALLHVLETFNWRLSGSGWETLKTTMANSFLLPLARRRWKSWLWTRRYFAARVLALVPLAEDEKTIISLMNDRRFLVSSIGALAAVRLGSQKAVDDLLSRMTQATGFSYYFFRDLLVQAARSVIEQVVLALKNRALHRTALDVLGAKSWGLTLPPLTSDLISRDPILRLLAFRVLLRNPTPDARAIFVRGAQDKDSEVRKIAVSGLALFEGEEVEQIFERALSDADWQVRIAAGKALKGRGERGEAVLLRQRDPIAQEAATYALEFGGRG